MKIWKIVKPSKRKNIGEEIKFLKKKGVILSPWIEDIYLKKKNNISLSKKTYNLYKVKVKFFKFKKPTTLGKIYKKIKELNFSLVNPDIALRTRLLYKNQNKGEWLRFATPLNSMIDSDGVPHLPKLGSALNKLFIETYWAYEGAVFHPHNEFISTKDDFKKNKIK